MPPRLARSDSESTLKQDAAALHAALSHLVRVYQYRDRDRICCHDVSVTQCHALEILVERGPLRSMALADALRLDKSTTSRVVDALVRKGYVEKAVDADDARALSLRATRRGRGLCERITADLVAQQAELLRGLDSEVRAGATEIIRRLARAAETRFADGAGAGACATACAPGSQSRACG